MYYNSNQRRNRKGVPPVKKNRLRFRWGKLVIPAAVLVAAGFFGVTLLEQQARLDDMAAEEQQLTKELDDLSIERDRLDRMIDYASTDAYAEQMARDVLGWVKKGETRYVAP